MQQYKTLNGTSYDSRTPDELVRKLEGLRLCNARVRFFYGNPETGVLWAEEYDTIGRIGRSTGSVKIPLLTKTIRSTGGGAILTHCILRVDTSPGVTFWQAKNYQKPVISVEMGEHFYDSVWFNGILHGVCGSTEQASRLASFLAGERWAR